MSRSGAGTTWADYIAISAISALGWLTQIALAYEVTILADEYAFGPTVAGLITALEAGAMAVTVLYVGRSIDQRDKRRLTLLGILIAITASLISLSVVTLPTMAFVRALFGVGLGLIAAATNALPSQRRNPERLFASMQFAVGLVFIIIMYLGPPAHDVVGRLGLFWIELSILLLFSPLALLLPGGVISSETVSARSQLPPHALPFLMALGTMFVSASATWSFAAQAGQAIGLSPRAIADSFTASALANNIGALAATALGLRLGYRLPVSMGYVLLAGATLLMYANVAEPAYVAGVVLFNPAFAFLVPYLQGKLAEIDASGRSAALGGAAVMIGGSIGPAVGGGLAAFQSMTSMGICIAMITLISALTFLMTLRRSRTASAEPAPQKQPERWVA
jgi:predicted MFS family arabinose efflux permease